jgi:hypothetical protein
MLCQGYFAFFLNPTALTFTSSAVGPTQVCNLQVGWNLVGNPFAGAAQLPTGVDAYYLNTTRGSYDIVNVIPAGGSVWIDATPDTRQLKLTIVPTQSSNASTVTIDAFAGAGPYRVHVGDSIKVEIASASNYLAQVNSAYLALETAGISGPMSCIGQSCAISLVNRFWIYQAVAEGTTYIVFNPSCLQIKPACGIPSFAIEIDIVP